MRNVKRLAAGTVAVLVGLVVGANSALAQVSDPTNGAYDGAIDDVTAWITGVGIVPLFGLAALTLILGVAFAYFRKGRQQAKA